MICEWLGGMMPVKSEAALQSALKLRKMREPPPVGGKLITVVEPVPSPKSLQRKIGERRRRLTDCKAWMRPALEQNDVVAEHGEHAREERSGEPAADNCNVA